VEKRKGATLAETIDRYSSTWKKAMDGTKAQVVDFRRELTQFLH
jgi:hypothetical protein